MSNKPNGNHKKFEWKIKKIKNQLNGSFLSAGGFLFGIHMHVVGCARGKLNNLGRRIGCKPNFWAQGGHNPKNPLRLSILAPI